MAGQSEETVGTPTTVPSEGATLPCTMDDDQQIPLREQVRAALETRANAWIAAWVEEKFDASAYMDAERERLVDSGMEPVAALAKALEVARVRAREFEGAAMAELADRAGVGGARPGVRASNLRRQLDGREKMSFERADAIAAALGLRLSILLIEALDDNR